MRILLISIVIFLGSGIAVAAEHIVKAVGVKFDPMFLVVEPGDTVTWTNMPAHLVESIGEMSPEAQPAFISEMGETVSYTFDVEGVVTYKCTPHWGARMGGMILVGSPDDLAGTLDTYLETADAIGALKPAKGLVKKFRKMLTKSGRL